ncbi:HAD-like protein, partial [Ascodesmis nigricans]
MSTKHLALDLYGTLLSTSSTFALLSTLPTLTPTTATSISTLWRTHQLTYTFRLNSTLTYLPFIIITELSLKHALHDHSIAFTSDHISAIMALYQSSLSVFPDVAELLDGIAARGNAVVDARVFSNGDMGMINAALSGEGAEVVRSRVESGVLKEPVSVDAVGRYKPAKETYELCRERVGKEVQPRDMVLVSSNPFDIVGAAERGWETVWVDREGKGWGDGL